MAFNIGSAVAKIKADTTDFQNGIKQVTGSKGLGGVGTLAGKLGPILAGAFAVKKVVDFGASVLKTAGQFEQYQMAFKTMLGSADKANELFNDLKDFAKKTPFNFEEVVKGGKQLLAMGGSAEDVTTELGMLGDVAAGLGVPIERLVYNFGQVRAIGKLTGREVRDFANAGIPLIGALADQFGKTKAEIQYC